VFVASLSRGDLVHVDRERAAPSRLSFSPKISPTSTTYGKQTAVNLEQRSCTKVASMYLCHIDPENILFLAGERSALTLIISIAVVTGHGPRLGRSVCIVAGQILLRPMSKSQTCSSRCKVLYCMFAMDMNFAGSASDGVHGAARMLPAEETHVMTWLIQHPQIGLHVAIACAVDHGECQWRQRKAM
jgi:hypothetical protein